MNAPVGWSIGLVGEAALLVVARNVGRLCRTPPDTSSRPIWGVSGEPVEVLQDIHRYTWYTSSATLADCQRVFHDTSFQNLQSFSRKHGGHVPVKGDKGLSRGTKWLKIPEFPKLVFQIAWNWHLRYFEDEWSMALSLLHVYILAFCFFATESFDWCLWVCLPNCSNEQLNSISFSYFAP